MIEKESLRFMVRESGGMYMHIIIYVVAVVLWNSIGLFIWTSAPAAYVNEVVLATLLFLLSAFYIAKSLGLFLRVRYHKVRFYGRYLVISRAVGKPVKIVYEEITHVEQYRSKGYRRAYIYTGKKRWYIANDTSLGYDKLKVWLEEQKRALQYT